jgi:hypothetical protein
MTAGQSGRISQLSLLLIAYDVPFLRKPVGSFTIWGAEKWTAFRLWVRQKRGT